MKATSPAEQRMEDDSERMRSGRASLPPFFVKSLREAMDKNLTKGQILSILGLAAGLWTIMDQFEPEELLCRSLQILDCVEGDIRVQAAQEEKQ